MQYELDESDVFSMDLLSISLDEESLLEICPLGGRSTMVDVITVFCWRYGELSFSFFLI